MVSPLIFVLCARLKYDLLIWVLSHVWLFLVKCFCIIRSIQQYWIHCWVVGTKSSFSCINHICTRNGQSLSYQGFLSLSGMCIYILEGWGKYISRKWRFRLVIRITFINKALELEGFLFDPHWAPVGTQMWIFLNE